MMEQELDQKLELHNPTVYQTNENCQVFTGPICGCVFAMPGAHVNLSASQSAHDAQTSPATDEIAEVPAMQEKAEKEEPKEEPKEELNYFAPTKNIQMLLKQGWFKELRTSDKYDEKWTDDFMSVLMASAWKNPIAQAWSCKDKRMKLKCMMIGLLRDNGVLKGSYSMIARQLNMEDEDAASLANYMGQGKKQGYALWVADYVKNH